MKLFVTHLFTMRYDEVRSALPFGSNINIPQEIDPVKVIWGRSANCSGGSTLLISEH